MNKLKNKTFIIYNPNSKGGNYKYAIHTGQGLLKQGQNVQLLLPGNAPDKTSFTVPVLMADEIKVKNKSLRKLYFIIRTFLNPLFLFFYVKRNKRSFVIFNDFDQLSALFWVPLFKWLKNKHRFGLILHDPDRDAYPGGISFTRKSMKAIMSIMDVAFFHEQLPAKEYYRSFKGKKVSIPHGIYPPAKADKEFLDTLKKLKGDKVLLTIPGNIRDEKNYELIIEAMDRLPRCKLLIAGSPSNSSVNINELKKLAIRNNAADQIIWQINYLSDEEFTAVLEVSDLILLYYKKSFTSQSGILNQIAPLKKNVLISNTPSALTKIAKEFNIGTVVKADDKEEFVKGVSNAIKNIDHINMWDDYIEYASWEKQSKIIINAFNNR